MSIIDKLWDGEIFMFAQIVPSDRKYKEAEIAQENADLALSKTLSEEQLKLFAAFKNARTDVSTMYARSCFDEGFRLGGQMALEISCGSKRK